MEPMILARVLWYTVPGVLQGGTGAHSLRPIPLPHRQPRCGWAGRPHRSPIFLDVPVSQKLLYNLFKSSSEQFLNYFRTSSEQIQFQMFRGFGKQKWDEPRALGTGLPANTSARLLAFVALLSWPSVSAPALTDCHR